jgi:hypothetical protein
VLRGDYLRQSGPEEFYHDLWGCFINLTFNFKCLDRRRCGVVYEA